MNIFAGNLKKRIASCLSPEDILKDCKLSGSQTNARAALEERFETPLICNSDDNPEMICALRRLGYDIKDGEPVTVLER